MSKKLVLVVLLGFAKLNDCADFRLHPNTGLNLFELFAKTNQNYQNISIETKDGYLLNTVRLWGENNSTSGCKGAVLLCHGIFSNPQDFLLQDGNSLGTMLANAGYSVFLMSNRGSTYSRGHQYLSPDSEEYWDFSFHDIGIYDISANMDMITKVTGDKKMHVITHSQGSTALLALLCDLPEYQEKIISGHLLAPIVYLEHNTFFLINLLKPFVKELAFLGKALNLNKGWFSHHPLYTQLAILLCHEDSPLIDLCVTAMSSCSNNPTQINTSLITVFLSNTPAGGSFKSLIHYLQMAKANKFQHFDYGLRNLLIYGRFRPSAYNLSGIKANLLIWFGRNDCLSGEKDFERVASDIATAIPKEIEDPLWNHIDFLVAKDAKKNVYDIIVNYLCA